tara:strand:- start:217 stop:459 length:243 start_codon:yes stop_codon:yes gene_type:complete
MNIHWIELIEKRNRKLQASDWTQLPDAPISESKKAEWETYRQALRDIPNNIRNHENYVSDTKSNPLDGSVMTWSFPTVPS